MSFDERKKILETEYKKYFEILDLDMQTRALDFVPREQWEEVLLENLKNKIECEKILSQPTAYTFNDFYKKEYERKLEIYNKIIEGVE